MKKSFFIFNALLLTLSTMPLFARTISGTIRDSVDFLPGAAVYALDANGTEIPNLKTATDENGEFSLKNVPENVKNIKINSIGHEIKNLPVQENMGTITLEQTAKLMKPVYVAPTECTENQIAELKDKYATGGKWENGQCVPDGCIQHYKVNNNQCEKFECTDEEKQQVINDNGINPKWENDRCVPGGCIKHYKINNNNKCVKFECTEEDLNKINATNGTWDNILNICVPVCDENNGFTRNEKNTCVRTKCSKSEIENLKKQDKNVDTGKWEKGKCVPVCKNKHHLDGGKCVKNQCENDEEDWNGTKCVKVRCSKSDLETRKAKEGKWDANKNECIATKCADEKNFKLDKDSCVANDCPAKELEKLNATAGTMQDGRCIPSACIDNYEPQNGACVNAEILAKKQKDYDEAKSKEQSTANRMLGGLTTAATGIGGMQLAQGLAEKSADKDAEADMAAYIATMRCSYADGKSVKFGTEEIELPGANNAELMKLRNEYFALASDLKERKTALGMKPGIESEEILDRATSGLYDDEFVGIDGGNYASLYRATALNSEADQKKIADEQKKSKNRVIAGGVLAGAGVAGGILGNSLINGKLGEKLKEAKKNKKVGKETLALLEKEEKALNDLKSCLKTAGVKDTDDLTFTEFYPSIFSVKNVDCKNMMQKKDINATDVFADSTDPEEIIKMFDHIYLAQGAKLIGYSLNGNQTFDTVKENIKTHIQKSIKSVQDKFKEAETKDKESAKILGIDLGDITGATGGGGISSLASIFGGGSLSKITGIQEEE